MTVLSLFGITTDTFNKNGDLNIMTFNFYKMIQDFSLKFREARIRPCVYFFIGYLIILHISQNRQF